ncbi:hypothetical protein ACH5RR_035538 [Cinchona calisaya]|uniref:Peptidase C1A papain C-terminal domain-containing protein n=1 Tax=Cinchona calisaya TaxID=153742 RepID=A0ABD2Y0I2_9GENT
MVLTSEEFTASCNGLSMSRAPKSFRTTSFKYENVTSCPRYCGLEAVTPIKDEAIAATERITKLGSGKLISLSEQEIVDYNKISQDQGCNGGYMEDAYDFNVKNKGIATKTTYAYTAADGTCNKTEEASHAAKIKGNKKVHVNNVAALLKSVTNQPVSVPIDASGMAFQFYTVESSQEIVEPI